MMAILSIACMEKGSFIYYSPSHFLGTYRIQRKTKLHRRRQGPLIVMLKNLTVSDDTIDANEKHSTQFTDSWWFHVCWDAWCQWCNARCSVILVDILFTGYNGRLTAGK